MEIRWLGAFGAASSLHEALNWELNQTEQKELAAEPITQKGSQIRNPRIGLLVKSKAVIKKFNGDCFSIKESGRLVKTRNPRISDRHLEAWVRPEFAGIVTKNYKNLPETVKRTLKWFSKSYSLKVYELINNELKEIAGK